MDAHCHWAFFGHLGYLDQRAAEVPGQPRQLLRGALRQ